MPEINNVKDAVRWAEELEGFWKGYRLREIMRLLRKYRAMTQQELASRSTFSQSTLSDLETGRIDAPWSTIERVFYALDCEPIVLLRPLSAWPRRHSQWRS